MSKMLTTTGEKPFYFPQGLAGFTSAHQFGFIYEGVGDLVCMQSIDQIEAAFILTPWDEGRLGKPPEVSQEYLSCVHASQEQLAQAEDMLWMLVLNPFADAAWVTANLRAPILLNMQARRGVQCIQHDAKLPLRYHWMRHPEQTAVTAASA